MLAAGDVISQAVRLPLAVRYAVFAAVASSVNFVVQVGCLAIYGGPFSLIVAMFFGTVSGIIPKYLLDKRWIFEDRSSGRGNHARKFTLYTVLSTATTAIFWLTELLFDRLGPGSDAHYLGAAIGLAIGYWTKYRLDRKWVFVRTVQPETP